MRNFPIRAWCYALAVAVASFLLCLHLIRGQGGGGIGELVGFALLVVLAESVPVELAHASYSVGFLVVIAAMIASGPATAALAAAFGALDLNLRRRPDWAGRLFFNAGQLSLSAAAAGYVYLNAGGPVGAVGWVPALILPLLLAASVHFLLNVALVSAMVALVRQVPWRDLWNSNYRAASLTYFSFAVLGALFGILYLSVGWGAALFCLLPLLVARGAFHASAQLHASFEATFSSLVTAIEAKDLYTRGHAERVSRLAEMIAEQRGLSSVTVRKIKYAALMHDVGKLTVDTRVLQKPGKLTVEEFEHMKVHPIRGSAIVAEIDLLRDMVDGVRHHHERMDGRGYPDSLGAESLSDSARIIMVADAFDSMTSTRSYRRAMPVEAAFSELWRCAHTQFDAGVIKALQEAINRKGWHPAPEAFEGELVPRPTQNVHAAIEGSA